MFAALDFIEAPKKNIFRRIFSRRECDAVYEKKKIGEDEYYLITCKTYCGKADYRSIARLAGSESSRLLISNRISLPPGCGISAYCPNTFRRQLVKNSVLAVLRKAAVSPARIRITVYDRTAQDCDFLLSLLPYSIDLSVLTDRPNRYAEVRAAALRDYGAPVSIAGKGEYLKRPDILIALDPAADTAQSPKIIFTDRQMDKGIKLLPHEIAIPTDILREIPMGFDEKYFYAALYENTVRADRYPVEPVSFIYGNSEISINQAADIIKNLDNFY